MDTVLPSAEQDRPGRCKGREQAELESVLKTT